MNPGHPLHGPVNYTHTSAYEYGSKGDRKIEAEGY